MASTRPFNPSLALLALPLVLLIFLILRLTNHEFIYTLDDPYIHLALAKNIWAGNYGINLDEVSAPSSSIIWPFLLAPFASLPALLEYVPLIINALCMFATFWVIDRIFLAYSAGVRLAIVASLALAMNLFGLVLTGMEHSAQVLVVVVAVAGLLRLRDGQLAGGWRTAFFIALCLGPLLRYENLAISFTVLAYAFVRGERRAAAISFVFICASLGGFSLWLYTMGLGYLPSSILAKSAHSGLRSIISNVLINLGTYGFMLLAAAGIFAAYIRKAPAFAIAIAAATGFHFLFGRLGWFGRYEVYYVIFILLIGLHDLLKLQPRVWALVLLLPFAFVSLARPTIITPPASARIYLQQAKMADIARDLGERIAVNDLGLVALRSGQRVLDLWGLGSIDALRARMKNDGSSDWISALMRDADTHYAVVYDAWFPNKPANWIKVGQLSFALSGVPADARQDSASTVSFYASSPEKAVKLRQVLQQQTGLDRRQWITLLDGAAKAP